MGPVLTPWLQLCCAGATGLVSSQGLWSWSLTSGSFTGSYSTSPPRSILHGALGRSASLWLCSHSSSWQSPSAILGAVCVQPP